MGRKICLMIFRKASLLAYGDAGCLAAQARCIWEVAGLAWVVSLSSAVGPTVRTTMESRFVRCAV